MDHNYKSMSHVASKRILNNIKQIRLLILGFLFELLIASLIVLQNL